MKYKITVKKESFVEVGSDNEASQIAEFMASRESSGSLIGNCVFVYYDYEKCEK